MCDCIPSCILFYDDFIVTTNRQFFVLLCHFKFKAVVYKYFCVNYFYSCIVYCFISLPVDSRKCIMNCHKVKFQWNFYVVSKSDLRCLKFYIRVKVHEAHQRNKMELQPSIYKCKAWQCLARSHFVLHHNYYRVSHIIGPTLFFVISRVLEHLQRNFLPFFNSPGNLLHYSHKNFENWFRNSWDNWDQSWN